MTFNGIKSDFNIDLNVSLITNLKSCKTLPPEPQYGNIEYKLKIINPSTRRFEHLLTQMKWRLNEGQGQAIYKIGVKDNGLLYGLSEEDMEKTLDILKQLSSQLGASLNILSEQYLGNERKIYEVLIKFIEQIYTEIRISVIGNSGAGKSTLLGVLKECILDNGKGSARLVMLRHKHELQSGRTSSISQGLLSLNTQIDKNGPLKFLRLFDLPGYKKYIPITIRGLCGYKPHYVIIVLSALTGPTVITIELLKIIQALNLKFLVVITKIDRQSGDHCLEKFQSILKDLGFIKQLLNLQDQVNKANELFDLNEKYIIVFQVSSVTGEGINILINFLSLLPNSTENNITEQDSSEFLINEVFSSNVLAGIVKRGIIAEGMEMLLGPLTDGSFCQKVIISIHYNGLPCHSVQTDQCATICLDSKYNIRYRSGMVLLSLGKQESCIFFKADVVSLYPNLSITPGMQILIYLNSMKQNAVVLHVFDVNKAVSKVSVTVLFKFITRPEYVIVGNEFLLGCKFIQAKGKIIEIYC